MRTLWLATLTLAAAAAVAGLGAATTAHAAMQQCGIASPNKCLGNHKLLRQFKPTDPESASAAACCAACQSANRCEAFQMVVAADAAADADGNKQTSSSCWLHSEYPKTLLAGACQSHRMVPAASPVRANRTSFSGIWVQHDPGHLADVVRQDFIVGADIDADWNALEIADGVWDWSAYDAQLDYAAAQGYFIETALQGGESTPHWLYNRTGGNKSVPLVLVVPKDKPGHSKTLRMFPYYLDATYRGLFLRAIQSLADHIAGLPERIRSRVVGVQVKYGDSGDDTPWHGTAKDTKWDIPPDVWHNNFTLPLVRPICDIYTTDKLHPLWNDGIDQLTYQTAQCPGSFIKAGMVTHGFQVNYEYDNYFNKGKICHTAGYHCRGESWPFSVEGYFAYAPLQCTFAHLLWQLTFAVDMPQLSVPPLVNKSYYPIYRDVYNRYANSIPREPVTRDAAAAWAGAILNLRDGLDSNDTARFPEAKYGPAQQGGKAGQARMLAIANDPRYKMRGAVLKDAESASKEPMGSRKRTAPNDVGWRIWRDNYGNGLLTQLNPSNTSVGWWHVGPSDQYHGRYARGLDVASGRTEMSFTLDRRLWGGLPLSSSTATTTTMIKLVVVYFDGDGHDHLRYGGNGAGQPQADVRDKHKKNKVSFEIAFDSQSGCRTAKTVTGSGSGRWTTVEIDVADGRFGCGCAHGTADVVLTSTTSDVIISTIEVYDPARVTP